MKATRKAASYVNLGRAYLRSGQDRRAREVLARALELQPRWFLPRLLLARSHGDAGRGPDGQARAVEILLDGPPSKRWRSEGLSELLRLYVELEDRRGLEALRARRLPRNLRGEVELAIARLLAEDGRFLEALELLQEQVEDLGPEAFVRLGDVFVLLERDVEALASYLKGRRSNGSLPLRRIVECWERLGSPSPEAQDLLLAVVEGLVAAGRSDEALPLLLGRARFLERELREGSSTSDTLASIYARLAGAYLSRNQTALAVEACHRILELEGDHAGGLRLLIDAYERQWRFERAMELCERLSLIRPSGGLLHRLASLYVRTGRLRAAVGALTRARRLGEDVQALASEVHERLLSLDEVDWDRDFDEANLTTLASAVLERSPQRAERLARTALFHQAEAVEARIVLGRALAAQERRAEAIREFRMALRLQGEHDVRPHVELARLLESGGDGEGAIECCRRGLRHHGGSAVLHFLHAELLVRRGLQVEGLSALNLACRLDPDHDFPCLGRGGRVSPSVIVAMYEQLLGIPPSVEDLMAEGQALLRRRRYAEAEEMLRKALSAHGEEPLFSLREHGMILLCLGTCLCNLVDRADPEARLQEALDLLLEAARLRRDDPRPHVLMAEIYQRMGLEGRAKEALDAAGRSGREGRGEDKGV